MKVSCRPFPNTQISLAAWIENARGRQLPNRVRVDVRWEGCAPMPYLKIGDVWTWIGIRRIIAYLAIGSIEPYLETGVG